MKKRIREIADSSWLFFLLIAGLIFLFTAVFSFNGLYGQDAHEYLRYTQALHSFFTHGTNPGDYFFPLLYPVCGAIISFLIPALFSLQLISIVSFVVAFCFLEKIIVVVFEVQRVSARIYLLLFFFLSPFMLRASFVAMSDMFCTMWIVMAFYAFIKYQSLFTSRYFLFFGMAATAAVMTRYVAAVLLFIPASMILIQFIKRFNLKYFLLTFLSVLLLTVPHFLIRKTDPAAFLHHPWLESWSLKNFFRTSFDTPDGHAGYTFPNIIYSFFNWIHPGYIFAGAFLVLLFRKKNIVSPGGRIFFAPVLLYSLFLAGIPLQNLRFLQLSFPVILILFFPLAIESSNYFGARIKKAALISFVVVIQLILFVRAFIPFYRYNHMEKEMAKEIKKYPVNTIYIFEMEGALKSYHVKNKIVGLWNQKLDSVESHSLLLFNPQKFESQWRGTNVMLNYEMIGQQKKIRLLKTFDHGWQLSELE